MAQVHTLPRTRLSPAERRALWRHRLIRTAEVLAGSALLFLVLATVAAIASYHPGDPSLNVATDARAANWLGAPGAYTADIWMQAAGLATLGLLLPIASWAVRLGRGRAAAWRRRWLLWAAAAVALLAPAWAAVPGVGGWADLPGLGGSLGRLLLDGTMGLLSGFGPALAEWMPATLFGLLGVAALVVALGLDGDDWRALGTGAARLLPERRGAADDNDVPADAFEPAEPAPASRRSPRDPGPRSEPVIVVGGQPAAPAPKVTERTKAPKPGQRPDQERQGALALGDAYRLPPLELLQAAPRSEARALDEAALHQNARLLESILDDFGVEGRIVHVRPGPVVTLYELEPAPGIKSSRVIGLADDIARSMSAISARVAVVPGRNVIGIELPNQRREVVYLRELMASRVFEQGKGPLPLVLGKDIAGNPVIVDLAPMPHLLIAGATGSGKSVGLNAMILSLLFRLTPNQCRFIMIDPKMLELSIYDSIPHLLCPVVTEPKKAIVALKWIVREMDERYRKMSRVAVRNLAAFNEKVLEAKRRGSTLTRRVHTGYDRETGDPVYEEESFDFEPMPLIVVVVDELADLMMTAGKEVEVLIARLAQKARAAGIHLILATQRPSVDVITGLIKANLPTRISFAVTSKIDSRTILNESGAEQLLGRGDMLFMPSGKQLERVHGPLVSDEEVEKVATFWRDQGPPDYLEGVTEDDDDPDGDAGGGSGSADGGDDLYTRAVEIVQREQKASTSFLQRHLRIGYNSAARLIETMEKRGVVSAPDHVGRREVMIDPDGTPR
jgi:S-DNA-T family DNA segregation ATPase FtsK/SpoIIIE